MHRCPDIMTFESCAMCMGQFNKAFWACRLKQQPVLIKAQPGKSSREKGEKKEEWEEI